MQTRHKTNHASTKGKYNRSYVLCYRDAEMKSESKRVVFFPVSESELESEQIWFKSWSWNRESESEGMVIFYTFRVVVGVGLESNPKPESESGVGVVFFSFGVGVEVGVEQIIRSESEWGVRVVFFSGFGAGVG